MLQYSTYVGRLIRSQASGKTTKQKYQRIGYVYNLPTKFGHMSFVETVTWNNVTSHNCHELMKVYPDVLSSEKALLQIVNTRVIFWKIPW